jgi:hypothetical protein
LAKIYEATFRRLSMKNSYSMGFILLEDVFDSVTGELFRDHTWVKNSNRLDKLNLKSGERIRFQALEEEYISNTSDEKIGLRHIRNVVKL